MSRDDFYAMGGSLAAPYRGTDELALAQFEALVLAQRPADSSWQPVTDYSFEARKHIEGEHPRIIEDTFHPTRVLDVGCGPGHLVRLLRERGMETSGCDIEESAEPATFRLDIGRPLDRVLATGPRWYDLVICREVLEHLTVRQIRQAVTNLCRLSSRFVYVTTRFAKTPQHLLDVATSDDLDPTHITMLNQAFLRVLFVLEGFKRRSDLETLMDWKHLHRVLVYERA